jgi:hypothetical protein
LFVEPILKRLENMVQSTVAHVSGSVIALFPFLVAVGFGTAAADSYLTEQFGAQIANLVLCGAYLVIALAIYGVARARERRHAEIAREQLEQLPLVNPIRAALDQVQTPRIDRMLVEIAGKSAPAAAQALRGQAKNLHLLIGAGLGIYIASRIVDALNRSHGYKAR